MNTIRNALLTFPLLFTVVGCDQQVIDALTVAQNPTHDPGDLAGNRTPGPQRAHSSIDDLDNGTRPTHGGIGDLTNDDGAVGDPDPEDHFQR